MALQQVTPGYHLEVTGQQKGHEPCDLVANSWPVHPMEVVAQNPVVMPTPRPESGEQDRRK